MLQAYINTSVFAANILLYGYMTFHLPICQLMDFWAVYTPELYTAVLKIHIQVFVWTYIFISLGCVSKSRYSWSRIFGSCDISVLTFGRTTWLFSKVAELFYFPKQSIWGFRFLQILNTLIFQLLRMGNCIDNPVHFIFHMLLTGLWRLGLGI